MADASQLFPTNFSAHGWFGRFDSFVSRNNAGSVARIVVLVAAIKRIHSKSVNYGYLWWPMPAGDSIHQGAFEARGIFGQHLYINPNEKLVVVVLSARPKPTGATVLDDAAFFAAVARSLR